MYYSTNHLKLPTMRLNPSYSSRSASIAWQYSKHGLSPDKNPATKSPVACTCAHTECYSITNCAHSKMLFNKLCSKMLFNNRQIVLNSIDMPLLLLSNGGSWYFLRQLVSTANRPFLDRASHVPFFSKSLPANVRNDSLVRGCDSSIYPLVCQCCLSSRLQEPSLCYSSRHGCWQPPVRKERQHLFQDGTQERECTSPDPSKEIPYSIVISVFFQHTRGAWSGDETKRGFTLAFICTSL